jgi:hypothetical protein
VTWLGALGRGARTFARTEYHVLTTALGWGPGVGRAWAWALPAGKSAKTVGYRPARYDLDLALARRGRG